MKKDKEWLSDRWDDLTSNVTGRNRYYDGYDKALMDIEPFIDQLDEPEPPVIPQFVADHIEVRKKVGKRLNVALSESPEAIMSEKMNIAIFEANNIYARAWLDGYTIEKEKQYRVVFPSLTGTEEHFLVQGDNGIGGFWLDGDWDYIESSDMKALFTEKKIKAIDERYWAFAEEVAQ